MQEEINTLVRLEGGTPCVESVVSKSHTQQMTNIRYVQQQRNTLARLEGGTPRPACEPRLEPASLQQQSLREV